MCILMSSSTWKSTTEELKQTDRKIQKRKKRLEMAKKKGLLPYLLTKKEKKDMRQRGEMEAASEGASSSNDESGSENSSDSEYLPRLKRGQSTRSGREQEGGTYGSMYQQNTMGSVINPPMGVAYTTSSVPQQQMHGVNYTPNRDIGSMVQQPGMVSQQVLYGNVAPRHPQFAAAPAGSVVGSTVSGVRPSIVRSVPPTTV